MKFSKKNIGIILLIILILFFALFILLKLNFYPPILIYDSSKLDKDIFKKQLKLIRENNFKVIPLEELATLIENKKATSRLIAITFAGGYKRSLDFIKILKEFNFPVTVFVLVNNIGKEGYLDDKDLRRLGEDSLIDVGSYTLSGKKLALLSSFELQKELFLSKKILEDILGKKIRTVSFNSGGFNREVLKAIKNSGYLCGVSMDKGKDKNIFALKGIKVANQDKGRAFKLKLSGFYHIFKIFKKKQ